MSSSPRSTAFGPASEDPSTTLPARRSRGLVFISYRRVDSGGWAGRLRQYLSEGVGACRVFMDVDSIAPGEHWRQRLAAALAESGVVIVVVGPEWLVQHDGARRLDDPDDLVRFEVSTTLVGDAVVIPVLVGGAALPEADALPRDLRPLLERNAVQLSPADFGSDAQRLLDQVKPHVGSSGHRKLLLVATLLVVSLGLLLSVGLLLLNRPDPQAESTATPSTAPVSSVLPMSGDYNVAVLPFSETTPSGAPQPSTEGTALAESVYGQLQAELAAIEGFQVNLRGPAELPPLTADTSEARAQEALALAKDLDADVVLYGTLDRQAQRTTLQPELIVSPQQLGDTPELAGEHLLGSPIVQNVDIDGNAVGRQAMRQALVGRGRAVVDLLAGLAYLAFGDRTNVLVHFTDAAAASPEEGTPLFKLFEGNALGELGKLEEADEAYLAGLVADPHSPRLLLGRAEVAYAWQPGLLRRPRRRSCPGRSVGPLRVRGGHTAAAGARGHRCPQPVRARPDAHVSRARGRRRIARRSAANCSRMSRTPTTQAITASPMWPPRLTASWGYLLALSPDTASTPADDRAALEHYEQAATIAPQVRRPERTAFYWSRVAELHLKLDERGDAMEAYDNAISLVSGADRARYEEARNAIAED